MPIINQPAGSGGGAANVSANTIIQTRNGSPVGALVPTAIGALCQDLTNGALYQAIGLTNTDWVATGGVGVQTVAGVTYGGVTTPVFLCLNGGSVNLSDTAGWNSNGVGIAWLTNGTDGQQRAIINLGSTGQFTHVWNADGTYTLPALASAATHAPRLSQTSPLFTIASGALPTVTCASGTGRQVSTTRDVETHTPVTFNPGVATTATCKVELSPDNTTYTELATITKPVGTVFDGEIDVVVVRVPAGWYIRLTVNAQATLGTTTYY